MKHLKIKVKMLLGFSLVSALTVIVGLVGILGLMSNNTSYSSMLERNVSAIDSLADIREAFVMQRTMLRSTIVDIQVPENMQSDIGSLKSYEAEMAEAMNIYESNITDPNAAKDYYLAKEAYLTKYEDAKQKILEAARLGDYDAAVAALGEATAAANIVTGGLRGTVDLLRVVVDKDKADLTDNSMRMAIIQAVVTVLSAACALAAGLYISSLISPPIKTMNDFFSRFGTTGDLSLSEEDQKNIAAQIKNRDETGQCIAAAAKMVARLTDINEKLGRVADGDLTIEMESLSEKDSIGNAFIKMIDNLNAMFGELRAASNQVSTGSEQIAQSAQILASGSSEQAASIEEFSNSLTELQEKTQRNAENSMNAANVNEKIDSMIDESVSSMAQMLEAMKGIDESSKNITRVIKVIDDIAFQTNILALNAAVEAARAGLHGKGFAVVADEVRNLAGKSAAAAKETAALIEGSSEKVREGNQIVIKTNTSLEAVASGSKEVVDLITEVSAASSEQARTIKEISQNVEQISSVVQENSASAEQSAAASEEMSSQAVMLNEIIARFNLKPNSGASGARIASRQTPAALKPKEDIKAYDEKYR